MKKFELDMTKGSILKNIILFAIPLMLTSLLQLLYNAADLIVVSRFAGSDAMASVGATSSLTNLLINMSIGFSVGSSVVVARYFGKKNENGLHRAVHTTILVGIIFGLITGVAGFLLSRPLLTLMDTPHEKVLDGATLYMKIIFIGVPASVLYNFGSAILRAIGDTRRPLYILAVSGLVNVVLNLILVIGFHMGVAGVAIATSVSNYISMAAIIIILMRTNEAYKLEIKKIKFYKNELKTIFKIGLPSGIQGSLFGLSNTVIQSSINTFGTSVIVGNSASVNIEGFMYVSMNAFYQAVLTSVGQNYGAAKKKRINKSIYTTIACVVVVGIALGAIVLPFSKQLLGIYIADSPRALDFGVQRMVIICSTYFLCGIMEVLTGALRGLGASNAAMINSLFGACGFRLFWVLVLVPMYRNIQFLYLVLPISWVVVIIMHLAVLAVVKPRAIKKLTSSEEYK
ncbi:MAG: MATE family efflux transporter [Clostridia bacterium]|nr:MATE family efflux transporter [Clostridia bacterium]